MHEPTNSAMFDLFGRVFLFIWRTGRGARLLGATVEVVQPIDLYINAAEARGDYERSLAAAYSHLSEAAFATAFTEGRTLTLEQAVTYALGQGYPN